MPINETLKSFKNSQVNVQIRQDEYISNNKDLSSIFAQDIANQAYDSLQTDEAFNTRAILSNLKDILLSKINGESSFLKESEIDALEVKTPAALKNHKPSRKECKARKKAYEEQYKLIEQLEKKDDLTTAEVKDVEKRLLTLEGYENDAELNALTEVKYQYLAEKSGEIELSNTTDSLSQYYQEHSMLKDVYQNFDYDGFEKKYNEKLNIYKINTKNIDKISYNLPNTNVKNETSSFSQTLENYKKAYKEIIESNQNTDKRLRLMLLDRELNSSLNELNNIYTKTIKTKIQRRHILEDYGINLALRNQEYDDDYSFENYKQEIFDSMLEDFSDYISKINEEVTALLHENNEDKEMGSVFNKLNYYKTRKEEITNFDDLFDLIKSFDNDISTEVTFDNDVVYNSMANYIRRIDETENTKLSEVKNKLKPILKEKYGIPLSMVDSVSLRENINDVDNFSEDFINSIIIKVDDFYGKDVLVSQENISVETDNSGSLLSDNIVLEYNESIKNIPGEEGKLLSRIPEHLKMTNLESIKLQGGEEFLLEENHQGLRDVASGSLKNQLDILDLLISDEDKASSSYIKVKDACTKLRAAMNNPDIVAEYVDNIQNLYRDKDHVYWRHFGTLLEECISAATAYINTHSGKRHTEKGKRRQKNVTDFIDLFNYNKLMKVDVHYDKIRNFINTVNNDKLGFEYMNNKNNEFKTTAKKYGAKEDKSGEIIDFEIWSPQDIQAELQREDLKPAEFLSIFLSVENFIAKANLGGQSKDHFEPLTDNALKGNILKDKSLYNEYVNLSYEMTKTIKLDNAKNFELYEMMMSVIYFNKLRMIKTLMNIADNDHLPVTGNKKYKLDKNIKRNDIKILNGAMLASKEGILMNKIDSLVVGNKYYSTLNKSMRSSNKPFFRVPELFVITYLDKFNLDSLSKLIDSGEEGRIAVNNLYDECKQDYEKSLSKNYEELNIKDVTKKEESFLNIPEDKLIETGGSFEVLHLPKDIAEKWVKQSKGMFCMRKNKDETWTIRPSLPNEVFIPTIQWIGNPATTIVDFRKKYNIWTKIMAKGLLKKTSPDNTDNNDEEYLNAHERFIKKLNRGAKFKYSSDQIITDLKLMFGEQNVNESLLDGQCSEEEMAEFITYLCIMDDLFYTKNNVHMGISRHFQTNMMTYPTKIQKINVFINNPDKKEKVFREIKEKRIKRLQLATENYDSLNQKEKEELDKKFEKQASFEVEKAYNKCLSDIDLVKKDLEDIANMDVNEEEVPLFGSCDTSGYFNIVIADTIKVDNRELLEHTFSENVEEHIDYLSEYFKTHTEEDYPEDEEKIWNIYKKAWNTYNELKNVEKKDPKQEEAFESSINHLQELISKKNQFDWHVSAKILQRNGVSVGMETCAAGSTDYVVSPITKKQSRVTLFTNNEKNEGFHEYYKSIKPVQGYDEVVADLIAEISK